MMYSYCKIEKPIFFYFNFINVNLKKYEMKHLVGTRGVLVKSNDSNLVHSCVYYCKYKWGKFVCKDYSLIFLLDPQEKYFFT